jgi:hypothetical protein
MEKYFGKDKVIAADLRYGNWVSFRGQEFQVNDIRGASGLMYVLPIEGVDSPGKRPCHEFDPILLTAEILDRLGVKQYGMNSFEHLPSGLDLYCSYELKYVHQLQNLYYALTLTELEWKN